jgi:hypothetical protein
VIDICFEVTEIFEVKLSVDDGARIAAQKTHVDLTSKFSGSPL